MEITSAALFISIALAVFGISYYYFTTRHRERMTIMERGLPPDFFRNNAFYLPFLLMLGIVSVGIALGILTGAFLKSLEIASINDLAFPVSIFMFLGISLVISYFVLKTLHKRS